MFINIIPTAKQSADVIFKTGRFVDDMLLFVTILNSAKLAIFLLLAKVI
jgi:hypothetical protein